MLLLITSRHNWKPVGKCRYRALKQGERQKLKRFCRIFTSTPLLSAVHSQARCSLRPDPLLVGFALLVAAALLCKLLQLNDDDALWGPLASRQQHQIPMHLEPRYSKERVWIRAEITRSLNDEDMQMGCYNMTCFILVYNALQNPLEGLAYFLATQLYRCPYC
jgi:hypothetical protein